MIRYGLFLKGVIIGLCALSTVRLSYRGVKYARLEQLNNNSRAINSSTFSIFKWWLISVVAFAALPSFLMISKQII